MYVYQGKVPLSGFTLKTNERLLSIIPLSLYQNFFILRPSQRFFYK